MYSAAVPRNALRKDTQKDDEMCTRDELLEKIVKR